MDREEIVELLDKIPNSCYDLDDLTSISSSAYIQGTALSNASITSINLNDLVDKLNMMEKRIYVLERELSEARSKDEYLE